MSWHEFLDDDLRERAALFVLDALDEEEARALRLHLPECRVCAREVESLARTARALTEAAPQVPPPPGLWERVVARVRTFPAENSDDDVQVWKRWKRSPAARGALAIQSAAEAEFQPTAIEGISVRQLSLDAAADRVTMLVRMAPGAAYPAHRHAAPEECLVLEGDLRVGAESMRAGDFQRAEADSVHGVQSTEGGCLLLIVSSLHDELL